MNQPRNPDFEEAVRQSFARQALMQTLGARITVVIAGEVEIRLPYRLNLTQQHGYLHAGVIASVLDSACGYAAFSLMPEGAGVLSVEFKTNLMAPARGEELIGRSRVLRSGRTISVCQADGYMLENSNQKLVATMIGTMMTIRDSPDVTG